MTVGSRTIRRDVRAAYSYLASSDPRVHVGLGQETLVRGVVVRWADGTREAFGDVPADRMTVLQRGSGHAWRARSKGCAVYLFTLIALRGAWRDATILSVWKQGPCRCERSPASDSSRSIADTAYIWAFASPTIHVHGGGRRPSWRSASSWSDVRCGCSLAMRLWRQPAIGAAAIAIAVATACAGFLLVAGNVRDHRWALLAHIARAGCCGRPGGHAVCGAARAAATRRGAIVRPGVPGRGDSSGRLSRGCLDLRRHASESRRPHRQSARDAAVDAGRGRRADVAVLPVVGDRRTSAGSSRRTSSWTRRRAASATRTSTSSGRARCTTSRRSTTSSTGSRSSTCRTWSARSRASGAPAATITPCSSTAASSGRSRSRSTRRKRSAGLGCTSCHSIVHVGSSMGNGDFTIEYPPLHELASSRNPLHPRARPLPDLPRIRSRTGARS